MFHRMTRQHPHRAQLIGLVIAGYLLVWTLFGVVAALGNGVLHTVVEGSVWLRRYAWVIGAGIFASAGFYRFTPLQSYCLDACRSPVSFLRRHWPDRHDRSHALRLGARHGLFCLGCCWSLMLLRFVVGMGNLGWMLLRFIDACPRVGSPHGLEH
jgi:predicted metal-binding membrane protein